MVAASFGYVDVCNILLHQEHHMLDKDGRCALVFALKNEAAETVKLLLPIEKDVRDSNGRTILHHYSSTDN